MDDAEKIFEFLKEARKMYQVYRFTPNPDGGFENDAEHSWAVALACMLVASRLEREFRVALDHARMLKMAIIHDLAEIHTGDTKTWDTAARRGKEEKEREGMEKLAGILPSDLEDELLSLWEECEKMETLEAQIVKSVDRMDPNFHRVIFGIGHEDIVKDTGQEAATTEWLDARQLPRHSFSKGLTELYTTVRDEMVARGMLKKS